MRRLRLEGGVAVVTGAASGIGHRLAVRLARSGCSLALVDINEAALSALAAGLRRPGIAVTVHPADIGRKDDILALPAQVLDAHGRVTLLVNNAGIALNGRFEQVALEDVERLIEINLLGVVRTTHVFLPAMLRGHPAQIVNLSSLFGIIAPPGQAAYAAAKFGVRGFSESLRHEMRGTRVGVTVVHPGGVATNIANAQVYPKDLTEEEIADERELAAKLLTLDADEAARQIIEAAVRRQPRLIVGDDARRAVAIQRLFPVGYWGIAELISPKLRRRHRKAAARAALARANA